MIPSRKKKHILLIEPDDTCRRIIAQRLSLTGFDVTIEKDGASAFKTIQEKKPDIIISELDIPRINGKQLCQKIRGTALVKHTPVIILTRKNNLSDKLSAFEAGASDYLIKPFSLAELEARITALLKT